MTKKTLKLCFLTLVTCFLSSHQVMAKSQFLPEATADSGIPSTPGISEYEHCYQQGYKYTAKSCGAGYAVDIKDRCPFALNSPLYKKCHSLKELCLSKGYVLSCPDGQETDPKQYCQYDSVYTKCRCKQCLGYDYTEAEAKVEGFVPDGEPCVSCNIDKYKRKPNPCTGFNYDTSNCGVSSCAELAGEKCLSGSVYKYKECKACAAPKQECSAGQVDLDTYWCNGALRCWWK